MQRVTVDDRFDVWAPGYEASALQNAYYTRLHDRVLDMVSGAVPVPGRMLDVGCGTGRLLRAAAAGFPGPHLVGVDLSEKMIARARELTDDPAIEYRVMAIEDISGAACEFDVVISSLALHYIERFDLVCRAVHHCLRPAGVFVLSVEHPIFTARAAQDWHYGQRGERLHWPVDHYLDEGRRQTRFLDHDVVKYHRTLANYVNALIDAGFAIQRVSEPAPTPELLTRHPDWRDETPRPMFLLIAAVNGAVIPPV